MPYLTDFKGNKKKFEADSSRKQKLLTVSFLNSLPADTWFKQHEANKNDISNYLC